MMNGRKSILFSYMVEHEDIIHISIMFNVGASSIDEGLTDLGFRLKPHRYWIANWGWLLEKLCYMRFTIVDKSISPRFGGSPRKIERQGIQSFP